MLDPKFVRENPELVRQTILNKGISPEVADLDKYLSLDQQRLKIISDTEQLNKSRNEIAQKLQIKEQRTPDLILEGKKLKEQEQKLREELDQIEAAWLTIATYFPNIPLASVKVGKDEGDNPEIYAWRPDTGEISKDKFGIGNNLAQYMPNHLLHSQTQFSPIHHQELLQELGVLDVEQGAKVSGTRFVYLTGDLVKLQFAIQNYLLKLTYDHGFTPIIPPLLVKEKALFGTSHFPEGRDQVYEIKTDYIEEEDSLFLVGSSEPANFAYFLDKTLKQQDLPVKIVAITPCFRSEVGSWGKDVRGLKRVHQFDKLEMDVVCTPEQSEQIYQELVSINIEFLKSLKLPFRIVEKCTGDSGYNASAKQADPEVWLPGPQTFMEVMTATNATDFQARRLNIKYITKDGTRKLCHTLNDTGVAFGRILLAIAENYQQADGSIKVPEILVPYTGFTELKK